MGWGVGFAELHVIEDVPSLIFVNASYTIEVLLEFSCFNLLLWL